MPGFEQLMLLLLAAVIVVPLAARFGLGAVLGYLLTGVVVGPWGFAVIGEVEQVMHVAEFGVILLLFVIGLELRPSRMWALRRTIFGFGSAQVVVCSALLAGFSLLTGLPPVAAVVAGLVLALGGGLGLWQLHVQLLVIVLEPEPAPHQTTLPGRRRNGLESFLNIVHRPAGKFAIWIFLPVFYS